MQEIQLAFECPRCTTNCDSGELILEVTFDEDVYSLDLVRCDYCSKIYDLKHIKELKQTQLKTMLPSNETMLISYLQGFIKAKAINRHISVQDIDNLENQFNMWDVQDEVWFKDLRSIVNQEKEVHS